MFHHNFPVFTLHTGYVKMPDDIKNNFTGDFHMKNFYYTRKRDGKSCCLLESDGQRSELGRLHYSFAVCHQNRRHRGRRYFFARIFHCTNDALYRKLRHAQLSVNRHQRQIRIWHLSGFPYSDKHCHDDHLDSVCHRQGLLSGKGTDCCLLMPSEGN